MPEALGKVALFGWTARADVGCAGSAGRAGSAGEGCSVWLDGEGRRRMCRKRLGRLLMHIRAVKMSFDMGMTNREHLHLPSALSLAIRVE